MLYIKMHIQEININIESTNIILTISQKAKKLETKNILIVEKTLKDLTNILLDMFIASK